MAKAKARAITQEVRSIPKQPIGHGRVPAGLVVRPRACRDRCMLSSMREVDTTEHLLSTTMGHDLRFWKLNEHDHPQILLDSVALHFDGVVEVSRVARAGNLLWEQNPAAFAVLWLVHERNLTPAQVATALKGHHDGWERSLAVATEELAKCYQQVGA